MYRFLVAIILLYPSISMAFWQSESGVGASNIQIEVRRAFDKRIFVVFGGGKLYGKYNCVYTPFDRYQVEIKVQGRQIKAIASCDNEDSNPEISPFNIEDNNFVIEELRSKPQITVEGQALFTADFNTSYDLIVSGNLSNIPSKSRVNVVKPDPRKEEELKQKIKLLGQQVASISITEHSKNAAENNTDSFKNIPLWGGSIAVLLLVFFLRRKPFKGHDSQALEIGKLVRELSEAHEKIATLEINQTNNDSELLSRANETIRKANFRITELKQTIRSLEYELSHIQTKNEAKKDELSHLDILGFVSKPDRKAVKARYYKLSSIYHPDKGGCDSMMKRITSAYNALK